MIALYILIGVLILSVLLLLFPTTLKLIFDGDFEYKLKIAFIPINFSKKENLKKPKKVSEPSKQKKDENKPKPKNFFEKLKDKKGFIGALKELFVFIKDCLYPVKKFLKFLKIKDVKLSIGVVGDNAANTAIEYGTVCSTVYPFLSFLESNTKIQYKSVDINADFEEKKSSFTFSLKIKTNIIFILILAIRIFKEYKKFSVRNDL